MNQDGFNLYLMVVAGASFVLAILSFVVGKRRNETRRYIMGAAFVALGAAAILYRLFGWGSATYAVVGLLICLLAADFVARASSGGVRK